MNHRPGPGIVKWLEQAGATNVKEVIHSFKMGAAADDEEMRTETTDNMEAIVANFAMVGSSKFQILGALQNTNAAIEWPGYWYTPEDFKVLADAVSHEMKTVGNTWKFWLVTAQK
jgi:hypothetical protein